MRMDKPNILEAHQELRRPDNGCRFVGLTYLEPVQLILDRASHYKSKLSTLMRPLPVRYRVYEKEGRWLRCVSCAP